MSGTGGASRHDVPARAFVSYDARIVFAVDLEAERIAGAELYTDLGEHRDIALNVFSLRSDVRARLEALALEVLARDPSPPLLRWSIYDRSRAAQ
jgi:hypothetical protein